MKYLQRSLAVNLADLDHFPLGLILVLASERLDDEEVAVSVLGEPIHLLHCSGGLQPEERDHDAILADAVQLKITDFVDPSTGCIAGFSA